MFGEVNPRQHTPVAPVPRPAGIVCCLLALLPLMPAASRAAVPRAPAGFGLGVVYHVPADPEQIVADLDAMKAAGIDGVLIGINPFHEPDWSDCHFAIEQADDRTMKVVILTPTDWFGRPSYDGMSAQMVDAQGESHLGFSYSCRPAMEAIAASHARLVKEFARHRNIVYEILVNEVWAWEDCSTWAQADFREYLRNLLPDVGYWNERWGTSFANFDTIDLCAAYREEAADRLRADAIIHRSKAYAAFFQRLYQAAREAGAPWPISGMKLYTNYYSNHHLESARCALDMHMLFREHDCNDVIAVHDYDWGSTAARQSKLRTLWLCYDAPPVVTEAWKVAVDDKAEAVKHFDESIAHMKRAKVLYNPSWIFFYQWEWVRGAPDVLRRLRTEVAPLCRRDLGTPVADDVGILDGRAAHYLYDVRTERAYFRLNDFLADQGLMPTQVYMDESQQFSLGRAAFDSLPRLLLVPFDRGLYADTLRKYPGKVWMQTDPADVLDGVALRRLLAQAGVEPIIREARRPPGVREQVYLRDGRPILGIANTTDRPARVSYRVHLDGKDWTVRATVPPQRVAVVEMEASRQGYRHHV